MAAQPGPAYAIAQQEGGDIVVTIHRLEDPQDLERSLAEHGVSATVDYTEPGSSTWPENRAARCLSSRPPRGLRATLGLVRTVASGREPRCLWKRAAPRDHPSGSPVVTRASRDQHCDDDRQCGGPRGRVPQWPVCADGPCEVTVRQEVPALAMRSRRGSPPTAPAG